MAHDVEEARHHLVLRHSHGEPRIEDGERGEELRAEHLASLEAFFPVGNHAAAVHLAAGAHHGEHGAHGYGLAGGVFLVHPVFLPRVLLAVGAGADGLGVVDGGTAADSQYEVHFVVTNPLAPFEHFLIGGVGHHAGVLHNSLASLFQGGDDSVVDAVFLDAATTVAQHHHGAEGLQLLYKIVHCILAEVQAQYDAWKAE